MSIPKDTGNVGKPASNDAALLATQSQREQDDALRTQNMLQTDQVQGMEIFAFLIALFTGMKPGENLGSEQAIKEFANVFHIDTASFQKTVNSYHSGKVSAHEAARQTYKQTDVSSVDMAKAEQVVAKYAESGNPLLELIADKESNGDYNRVYGAGVKRVDLTEMTIDQVQQWQRDYVNNGSPSSAAGKYQIINKTLTGLEKEMGLKGNELFDEKMQDRMAEHLLNRRGYQEYLAGNPNMPESKFMENIAKEWASMPKDGGGRSYYAGDGLNAAHATPATLLLAMRHTKAEQNGLTKEHNNVAAAATKGADAIPENEKDTGTTLAQNDQTQQPQPNDPALTTEMPAA